VVHFKARKVLNSWMISYCEDWRRFLINLRKCGQEHLGIWVQAGLGLTDVRASVGALCVLIAVSWVEAIGNELDNRFSGFVVVRHSNALGAISICV